MLPSKHLGVIILFRAKPESLPMFGRLPGARRVAELSMAVNEVARGKRVDKDEFVRRMNICRACDYNLKAIDMCRACGCYIRLKAMAPSSVCPHDKWRVSPCQSSVDAPEHDG